MVPCKLTETSTATREIQVLKFEPGVYIYEYPLVDHTCGCNTIQDIRQSFEDNDGVYNNKNAHGSLYSNALPETSEEKFWGYANVLYQLDIPQDKAFKVLQELGNSKFVTFLLIVSHYFLYYCYPYP